MPTKKTIYWLVAAAVLYMIAWNVGSGWLYILTTLLLALPLVSIPLSRMNVRNVKVRITGPESLVSGEQLPVLVEIRNGSRLPRFFLDMDLAYAGSNQQLFVSSLGPRETRETILEFSDVRRGSYDGAQIRISSAAPAGLARSRSRLEVAGPVTVYPVWHRLHTDWASGRKNAGYMVSSAVPTRNAASDYLGVREYRPEDSPRSIHWRSSARSGKLTSIEYSRLAAMTPVLLLDSFSDADRGNGLSSTFETAVTIAASMVHREAGHNRRFGIGASPGDASVRGLGLQVDEAMDWLAQVQATTAQPMDLSGNGLTWPEVTPVLLLTSHVAYMRLDQSELLQDFPHSIVVMLDGRGFSEEESADPDLMDSDALDELADRLESIGAEFLLITSRDEVPECLADL